jgi:malonyl-CoA/methylmalonyl-CoA synthetase
MSETPMTNHLFDLVRHSLPADPAAKLFLETGEGARYSYADLIVRSGARNSCSCISVRFGPGRCSCP